jgi:hypothetical protein
MRSKLGYHLFSVLVVIMPLAATAVKILMDLPDPPRVLDYVDIALTVFTSLFAFLLGHFRFLENWKRYRKLLGEALHICEVGLVDKKLVASDSAANILNDLICLFNDDTRDWSPDPNDPNEGKESNHRVRNDKGGTEPSVSDDTAIL